MIIGKILALPVEGRLWPNCLNMPIKNANTIYITNLPGKNKKIVKMKNVTVKKSGKPLTKSAAHRTRSKKSAPPAVKNSSFVHSLSSDSMESPKEDKWEKDDKELEMSSNRIYAKGTCCFFSFLTYIYLSMSLCILMLISVEPCFLVVEFKPPTIRPMLLSRKDLFAKRARDEKSTETES